MRAAGLLIALALPLTAVAQSQVVDALDCIRANLPERTQMELVARVVDADGVVSTQTVQAAIRRDASGSQTNLRVTAPADLAGAAYLIRKSANDASTFMYLPGTGHVQRIHGNSSGTILGTTLTAADLRFLIDGFTDGALSLGPSGQVHDWNTRRLTIVAAPDHVGVYDKIEVEFTEPGCVVVETRFFRDNRLIKHIQARPGSLRQHNRHAYVGHFDARTPGDGMHTEIEIRHLDTPARLDERLFAADRFYRR